MLGARGALAAPHPDRHRRGLGRRLRLVSPAARAPRHERSDAELALRLGRGASRRRGLRGAHPRGRGLRGEPLRRRAEGPLPAPDPRRRPARERAPRRTHRAARARRGRGRPDAQETLLAGLDKPHGLDLHDGFLYIGEGSAVARVRFDVATGRTEGEPERIVTGLPAGGNHWTRTVRVGPDGFLYVTVGSSCNACFEADERRAAMLRFRLDGSGGEIFARGLRNAVGFDWRPPGAALYATGHGGGLPGGGVP